MTIDEALHHLHTYSNTLGSGQTPQAKHEEAKRVAIATMRKYQKIEEILDQLIDSKIRTYDAVTEIEDIVFGQTEADNGNDD